MGRKLGFTSLFRLREATASPPSSPWPWLSCTNSRTNSFRSPNTNVKTINSVLLFDSTESSFTYSSESETLSTASEEEIGGEAAAEAVIQGLQSDRLFFEPGDTSSILDEPKPPFEESEVVAMESEDPYRDFRVSMEEIVAVHGRSDWETLESLLVWYLKVNVKNNHGFILGAFVDLLLGLSVPPLPSPSSSSSIVEIEEVKDDDGGEESSGPC